MAPTYFKGKNLALYSILTLLLFACTKQSPQAAEHERQLQKLVEMEAELEKLDGKIKDAGNDPGLRYNLIHDQELLKSRIERMRENQKHDHAMH